jgi:hypothetical protein
MITTNAIPADRRGIRWILTACALAFGLAGAAHATDITTCGQTVFPYQTGVVQVDLTCSDSASAVFLQDRAILQVGGHTITGGGIQCTGSCTVTGPGTVQQVVGNGNLPAINGLSSQAKIIVQDMTLNANAFGMISDARKTTLTNVTASGNIETGIWVWGTARALNVTTNDNGRTGFRSEVRGIRLVGLTATGNGQAGLINNGGGTHLYDSTLTGNAFPPFPGDPTVLDLFSYRRPRLKNTTCDHSLGPKGVPWGVCSGD